MKLVDEVLAGSRTALARALTQIENYTPEGRTILDGLFPHTGRAHLVGITGSPGTGKSSLVNQLALKFRRPKSGAPLKVGIIAIDPSSPFTGGAVLGDRVRMRDLSGDEGVFIRSMAARGALGGIARATSAAAQAMDAAGFEMILIETVGAGQSEVDIARLAHTTIVVEAPGLGDDIQAIKAGILEIADILVVNKADHIGVENTERALRVMLELAHPGRMRFSNGHHILEKSAPEPEPAGEDFWIPPVLKTIATDSTGIEKVIDAIRDHTAYLEKSGEKARRENYRVQTELMALIRDSLIQRWQEGVPDALYSEVLAELNNRRISPDQALSRLLNTEKEKDLSSILSK
ncbi:MAG: methylmalonyl Co-A mutase-associated GTPase MeaB [Anaerolineaceae bacterium]